MSGLFKSLDWRTIGVELVIVFVGLFAALQVDEWREDRELREQEFQALVRLQQDVTEAVESLEGPEGDLFAGRLAFLMRNRNGVEAVVDALEAGRIVGDTAAFEDGLIYYGHLPTMPISRAAFDALLANGVLGRIRDPDLAREITVFYDRARSVDENFSWWRNQALQLEPQLTSLVTYRRGDAESAPRGTRVEYDLASLLNDRELANRFHWALDVHGDWVASTVRVLDGAKALQASLDVYLATFRP